MNLRIVFVSLCCIVSFSVAGQIAVSSYFTNSDEHWVMHNNSGGYIDSVTRTTTAGNPGGAISYNVPTPYVYEYYQSPAKFLTQVNTSYNQALTFDLFVNTAGSDGSNADILLTGGGLHFYYVFPTKPAAGVWTSYNVTLSETDVNWHYNTLTGVTPTKQQWKTVLSSISQFEIRAKYLAGTTAGYISFLDNVVIHTITYKTPPSVTSIAPLLGIPGSTITITGSNFNTTASQNVVFFGGIKGTVLTASSTSVTATVPAGAQFGRVTVLDLSTGLSSQSQKNFLPQFNNNNDAGGRIIPASFNPFVKFPLDPATYSNVSIKSGDIDGDGWLDILIAEPTAHEFSIYRNTQTTGTITTASFGSKLTFPTGFGSAYGAVMLMDADGDGLQDVLMGSQTTYTSQIGIFRNISTPGNIAFAPVQFITDWSYADGALQSADIDGDGRPEILSTWTNSSGSGTNFFVFQNLSTPGNIDFGSWIDLDYGVVQGSAEISTGDLDNDGKIDVVFSTESNYDLIVMRNTSSIGSFSFQTPFLMGINGSPQNAALADLDNDGKLDLAYSGYNTNNILVQKNNSTPGNLTAASFATAVTLTSPAFTYISRIAAADINGDSKPDLVIGGSVDVIVFENNGVTGIIDNNTFITGTTIANGTTMGTPLLSDFNGDGKPDIAINQSGGATPYSIIVYENTCFPVPTIASASPASAPAGGSVTLTGTLLQTGVTPGPVIARQGSLLASTSGTTASATTATIPASGESARWSVIAHGLTAVSDPYPVTFPTVRTIGTTSFSAPVAFTVASNVDNTLSMGDFDDDGKTDFVIVANYHDGRIFQNTHATPGQNITTASLTQLPTIFSSYVGMATLDIDGDGKLDISSGYGIFKNASTPGTISFPTAPLGTNVTNDFNYAAIGDYNKDGKLDYAAASSSTSVSVFENKSTAGAFSGSGYLSSMSTSAPTFTRPSGNGSIISADFDGDGGLDFATCNPSTNNWSWFRNLNLKGTITAASFAAHADLATGATPYGITTSDFDGDGKPDVAICNSGEVFVSVYRNTSTPGTISFAAPVPFPVVTKAFDLVSQDLDGDGKAELVIIHQGTVGSMSILQNKSTVGTISFNTSVNITMTHKPQELVVADVNQDNKPDIIITSDQLLVFQNLIASVTLSVTQQPSNAEVCQDVVASFTTAAAGTSNITYKWQSSPLTPVNFTDISDGNGFSNSATATLTIDPSVATTAGQLQYRCAVNGDIVPTMYSNTVLLTVDPVPAAPGVSGTTICTGSDATFTATGTTNGFFRWYAVATGGTSIADAVNSTYTVSGLTATTTYYASITNGSCESSRVPVIVTVNSCSGAPVIETTTGSTDAGGVVTIPLMSLISDANDAVDYSTLAIVSPPSSGARASIDSQGILTIDYSGNAFVGTDQLTIQVCGEDKLCTKQTILINVGEKTGELVIYQGISPDGNDINETWVIKNIDVLTDTKQNHVTLFNRWGDKVFDIDNYDNSTKVFSGSGTNGDQLPSGTYFYRISFSASTRKTLTGYLSLKR